MKHILILSCVLLSACSTVPAQSPMQPVTIDLPDLQKDLDYRQNDDGSIDLFERIA